jgi:hypothetical protein
MSSLTALLLVEAEKIIIITKLTTNFLAVLESGKQYQRIRRL